MWLEVEARLGKYCKRRKLPNDSIEGLSLDEVRCLLDNACRRLVDTLDAKVNQEVA